MNRKFAVVLAVILNSASAAFSQVPNNPDTFEPARPPIYLPAEPVADLDEMKRLTSASAEACLSDPKEIDVIVAYIEQLRQAEPEDQIANEYFTLNHLRTYLLNLARKQSSRFTECIDLQDRLKNEFAIKEAHALDNGRLVFPLPLQVCRVRTTTGSPLRFRVFPHINNVPPVTSDDPTIIGRLPDRTERVIIKHVYQEWAFVVAEVPGQRPTVGWVSYQYLDSCRQG